MDELLEMRPLRHPAVAWRSLAGEVVLIAGDDSEELNEVAGRIWELCDGRRSVREMAALIVAEFDVDQGTAERDTAEFVRELLDSSLLVAGVA